MKVAIIADSHFDTSNRFEECVRVHQWIANDMEARGVDLVLHAGDVFERKSNPQERNAVAAWLQQVASFAPVVIVRGNHDAVGDLKIFGRLDTKREVEVREDATLHVHYGGGFSDCVIACVPWPRKAELLASVSKIVSPEESGQLASECLRALLHGLSLEMNDVADPHMPRILLMHGMIEGSLTSSGQPLVGCDMELGLADLSVVDCDLIALGHIHKGQDWTLQVAHDTDNKITLAASGLNDHPVSGVPVIYPGSPRRTAFGEIEDKGYVITEFNGRQLIGWERVTTPATPMLLLEAEFHSDINELVFWHETIEHGSFVTTSITGAELRLRYTVDADARASARSKVDELTTYWITQQGALSVKLEEVVIATTRSRTPEITQAKSLIDKLKVLWRARDTTPTDARIDVLSTKLNTIEMEDQQS